ncbi:sensor histidine kinase [Limoniibacter endophyticus]|uniref:C4-dicarboxylate transport sensor protein DctB n=1 Tax=Limoniibacter endophyticus TaxID=1565040 RepID=A0A8J3GHM9_9HYPH|nr:ATP-binding protein [Limoniibacter endophyticus]GHC80219.1 two-component sensor histidine kinase [Limoniibacter endophyticus]
MSDVSYNERLQRSASYLRFFVIIAVLATLAVSLFAVHLGRSTALADMQAQARTDTTLKIALLRAVLERSGILPQVLARDPDLRLTLKSQRAVDFRKLNEKLELVARETGAAVIYAVRVDGLAVAASNWREPDSFVGNDYSFRAYFYDAMKSGAGKHYALGTVSRRPGLYVSRRIDDLDGTPLGAIVVKLEFDQLERDWASSGNLTFITDEKGVVLVTSNSSLRFRAMKALSEQERETLRASLQFGDASLEQLDIRQRQPLGPEENLVSAGEPIGKMSETYLDLQMPVEGTGWTINYLAPVSEAIAKGIREWLLLSLAALFPVLAGSGFYLRKRHAADLRLIAEQEARDALERRVEERTSDLKAAHGRLEAEIEEHRETERKLQAVQQELVSANRLAILGQVVAGVAHEVNQPLATIRTYADNALSFLSIGRAEDACQNLTTIASLTERIARITQELRNFARKGKGSDKSEAIPVGEIIDGALMLLRARFRTRMEALEIEWPSSDMRVMGSRIRLEQVLINLLQNAFEAIGERSDGEVRVYAEVREGRVHIVVHDNGVGLSPMIRAGLFTPFNTSKEQGLGLGLVISREIITEHGGTLSLDSDEAGTRATIIVERI